MGAAVVTAPLLVAVLVGLAVLLVPGRPSGRLRALAANPTAPPGTGGRGRWRRWRGRDLRPAAPGGTDVAAVAAELAALTRGGLSPVASWEAVTPGLGADLAGLALAAAARAAASGRPVRDVLVAASTGPRRGRGAGAAARAQLAVLAATLGVQEATGAPVADLLDRAAAGLRADADADLARRSALAAPLATARVLVALPPLGLGLGVLVGGDPVQVLVSSPAGRWCFAVGALCAAAGWAWSRALVRRAVRPP